MTFIDKIEHARFVKTKNNMFDFTKKQTYFLLQFVLEWYIIVVKIKFEISNTIGDWREITFS